MENPASHNKPGEELDRFKRRLIRAVARLLLHEKKQEEDIWIELRKETGCDCQLLWMRMRALTVKKLDRLLIANDRMDSVPKAARMSLTDWLLFDLVLVHQKIDLIGQNNAKDKEDRPVLVELFELVKMFELEYLHGEKLAEAWSLATLYYNNKGHQCSPMLLQRRWYQLKEVTRFKFYDFWYAYRGNLTRVNFAEPFKPSPLQTAIAKTFKMLIVQPFPEWEELIKQRLVTMPDEFEKNMKERAALKRPQRKPSVDVPDLVMIEPRIDTIDLRLEPDDNATDENVEEEVPLPPLVRIKEEPIDDIDVDEPQIQPPKKSLYEVVLESTALENEQLDNIDAEELEFGNNDNEIEETEEAVIDSEESLLPQISSVFGNVSDTSVLANIDEDRVYGNAENTEVCGNVENTSVVNTEDTNVCNDKNTGEDRETIVLDDVEDSARDNEKDRGARDNIGKNSVRHYEEVIDVSADDKDYVGDTSRGVVGNISVPGEINEISDDDDIFCDVNVNVTSNADETSVTDSHVDATNVTGNVNDINVIDNAVEASVTGNVEVIDSINGNVEVIDNINVNVEVIDNVNGNVEVIDNVNGDVEVIDNVNGNVENTNKPVANENEPNADVLNAQINNSTATNTTEVIKNVEIINSTSHPVVITDSDDDDDNVVKDLAITNKRVPETTEEYITAPKSTIVEPMDVDSTPELLEAPFPEPLTVSGNEVMAEDIVETKVKTDIKADLDSFMFGELPNDIRFADEGIVYIDEDDHDENNKCDDEDNDTPKIDEKLLMYPIVYTTRLDDMSLPLTKAFDHINNKHLLDVITKKSKPILKEENVNEETTVNDSKKTIEDVPKDDVVPIADVPKDDVVPIAHVPKDDVVPIADVPSDNDDDNDANVIDESHNVTSDDDDSDANVIDESQKVKPTSYLLQKPRSRRYHPIQLCKNPDFNTRLKRLSVGFFGSPRNRVLIKSCKPLTIDLSKAFESKLISGTLYLKPVDHNVVTEVIDDTESRNVSVLPSALPAQSLIDNSKVADILPILRQCLEASKQPEVVAPTSERNKVINLPDITEIRRINQRLLTAEITPIQIQNNQPQVPVTIVTSLNTPTYPVHRTITIAETNEDLRTDATDARGPPRLLDITDDSPTKTIAASCSSTGRNTFDTFRPRLVGPVAGRPPRMINGKRVFPPKTVVWKPRQYRPEIPWLSRSHDATIHSKKLEDTLLTLDALNKMLFLLTDKLEPEVPTKKKPKLWRKNCALQAKQVRGRPKKNPKDSSYMLVLGKVDEPSEEQNPKCQKPKINIKPATNYPPDKDKTVDEDSEPTKNKVKYCCWARQRMLQMLFRRKTIPPHECPKLCGCCCRTLLKDYVSHEQNTKNTETIIIKGMENSSDNVSALNEGIVSSKTVEGKVDNSVQTVETSVQVLDADTVLVPEETPVIDIDAINTESTTNTATENEPIYIDSMDIEGDVPVLGGEVSVTTTAGVAPLAAQGLQTPASALSERSLVPAPVLKNHNVTSCVTPEVRNQAYRYTRCISSDNQSGGVIFNAIKTPSTRKILAVKKSSAPITLKANTLPPPILNEPSAPPKTIKEKMIFLNSKHISEKPTASPVFLGKNKILLTTVKFPPSLKLFQEAKDALRPSLNLPYGVHLVMLPNETISYKIDLNVEVTATDMAAMPAIIAAVQAHMNIHAAQKETLNKQNIPPSPGITEGEVVDLVDDDDEPPANVNENENNKTLTKNSDGCVVGHNAQIDMSYETKENRTDSNININVIETEKDSNQIESASQNTVTDIQEDVQRSSQNEILSASTEREQDQPDPSNQKVRAEIDDQPKPSSQTECTDLHKVSAEQALDQPDPSSQKISAEKDDQPKPSSEPESTDVHEGSVEQAQSETSGQNVSIDVQDHPVTATENVSTEVSQKSTSEPSRPKPKNILSDLMEMSGILDEDLTPEIEETQVVQPSQQLTLEHAPLVTPLPASAVEEPAQKVMESPAQQSVKPPALAPLPAGTPVLRIPGTFNRANPLPPKLKSPLGELTPITSLCELKYACANKGVFFKLDFESGFLVPINVCMKPQVQKPVQPPMATAPRDMQVKSVIDLTEDDDKTEENNTEPDTSPSKRSLLLVNNLHTGGFTGPVKPVKLFKALKPSILRKLDQNKMRLDRKKKEALKISALDHKIKRKQFLRTINLNADTDAGVGHVKYDSSVPVRLYVKKMMVKRDLTNTYKVTDKTDEPIPTTSSTEPNKNNETTILSDDDSSDDEPLAKKVKRKNDKVNAPESVTKDIELEPAAVVEPEAPVDKQIVSELPPPDVEHFISDDDIDLVDQEAPMENQSESESESELPAAVTDTIYMSDDENEEDNVDPEAPFGVDLNESNGEDEDCILGV